MFVLDLNYFGCLRINFSNEMYTMIFTHKLPNMAAAPVKGQTRYTASATTASATTATATATATKGQLRPATIKYDMFASLSTKGCNYCGTTK